MKINITLDVEVIKKIKELAKNKKTDCQNKPDSVSGYINKVLQEHVKKN